MSAHRSRLLRPVNQWPVLSVWCRMDRRLPASIEDLCRLVCKDELTASGAVLCGSRWVPLSQLIDVPEARRIGAAAMRR